LFQSFGSAISERVRDHHKANGGISRFEKIPLYLRWAGESAADPEVAEFCHRFSKMVLQAVIDSPWVPGAREYLLKYYEQQYFVLVTATPQDEIQQILDTLDISHCFREVHGAPQKKSRAIGDVMRRLKCDPVQALMVGDTDTDLMAAQANAIPFLLRRTPLNLGIQATYTGPMFDDLTDE
jgi:phosphoglycolate phosphatase-like HAD superfamily hydrolase